MALLRANFPTIIFPVAGDIRLELSRLDTLCTRSSSAVAKQIEEMVAATLLEYGGVTATEPDATAPATVRLTQLYPAVRDFNREIRLRVSRASKL